jgi:hypothetical protein
MIEVEESAEAFVARGAQLQLAFRFLHDRWQHFVLVRRSGEWFRLLVSLEASSDLPRPYSPALQDLRLERLADDVVEFQLLGQAGAGVYSAAIRFDASAGEIDFDLSARCRAPDVSVCTQSTYLVTDYEASAAVARSPTGSLAVRSGNAFGVALAPVAIPSQRRSECRIVGENFHGRIAAGIFDLEPLNTGSKATTLRWRYRITPLEHP